MDAPNHKKALITGITGQDGSYLAELLLSKGYEVHGTIRKEKTTDPVPAGVNVHGLDIADYAEMRQCIGVIKPDEIYHLAAQSNVADSFKDELGTLNVNINSTHCVLS